MKKDVRILFVILSAAFAMSASAADVFVKTSRTFTAEQRKNCQLLSLQDSTMTFILPTDASHFNLSLSNVDSAYVYGPISIWNYHHPDYRLDSLSADGCLYHTFPLSMLRRPGDSGLCEFAFRIYYSDGTNKQLLSNPDAPDGIDPRLIFINNGKIMIALLPGDDIDDVAARCQVAQYIRPLSDYNLSDSADIAHLTNFRPVPATACLYRSYHPYSAARGYLETEAMRMQYLSKLCTQHNIRSDIALSGNREFEDGKSYTCAGQTYTMSIPPYYHAIIENNDVLYVGTENGFLPNYNDAIFRIAEDKFGQWMAEIVHFVNNPNHPAPFLIHCSLGADRTGAFCGVIAALCGASWTQIANDFFQTSLMYIEQYRHQDVVRYELSSLIGSDPAESPDLQQAVAQHFISAGYLTDEEIATFVSRLTTNPDAPTSLSPAVEKDSLSWGIHEKAPRKFIRNGQLFIFRDGVEYTILGR